MFVESQLDLNPKLFVQNLQLDDQDDPGINAALSGNLADTPRTREALKRVGIMMSELKIKSFQDFYIPTDNVEKQRLR